MAKKKFQLEITIEDGLCRDERDEHLMVAQALIRTASRLLANEPCSTFRNITDNDGNIVGTYALKEVR